MRSIQVVLLLACVAAAAANPWRWAGCPVSGPIWGHPTMSAKRHTYNPTPDRGIKFALLSGGKAVATYCPGKAYSIRVTLPELRAFTLTTSVGIIGGGQVCGGKRINVPGTGFGRAPALTTSYPLRLPASVPSTIVLKVTSAKSGSSAFRHNSLTLRKGKC